MARLFSLNLRTIVCLSLLWSAAALPVLADLTPAQPPRDESDTYTITAGRAIALGKAVIWMDARDPMDYAQAHVPGAISVGEGSWDGGFAQLSKVYRPGLTVVVYCYPHCRESRLVAHKLRSLGYAQAYAMDGGFQAWQDAARAP